MARITWEHKLDSPKRLRHLHAELNADNVTSEELRYFAEQVPEALELAERLETIAMEAGYPDGNVRIIINSQGIRVHTRRTLITEEPD